jgi:hypothetical protein
MVGNYKGKEKVFIEFIDSWINNTIESSLWEKYCDLHIDEIDSIWYSPILGQFQQQVKICFVAANLVLFGQNGK